MPAGCVPFPAATASRPRVDCAAAWQPPVSRGGQQREQTLQQQQRRQQQQQQQQATGGGRRQQRRRLAASRAAPSATAAGGATDVDEVDVVVIGSGIGGLSCAGLLAKYGLRVVVCESHDTPGGAAHAWTVKAPGSEGLYHFESGPSLYSGAGALAQHMHCNPVH